ncbi:hypothetical protein BJY04DRAFT_189493 [Aspergillus karnatakaensis]|uniref:uncharacterized protein n=1 Tax=Aspergillus karnatakaensis TaxID=1810916 RepID=UPI003CCD3EB6
MSGDGIPFDKSRYGYLTDLAANLPEDPALAQAFITAKDNLARYLDAFQDTDKEAREYYNSDEDSGQTFFAWAQHNAPNWYSGLDSLQAGVAEIQQVGNRAYPNQYEQHVSEARNKLRMDAYQAGLFTPGSDAERYYIL